MLRVLLMAAGWGLAFSAGGVFFALSAFALANTPRSQYDVITYIGILAVSGTLTGLLGGGIIGLALLQESLRERMPFSPFLAVVCSWVLALAVALNVGYLISYMPGFSQLFSPAVTWTVGMGLGGAVAGALTARFAERPTWPLGSLRVLRIATAWGLALSVGAGAVFGFKLTKPINIGIFGAMAGGFAGTVLLWEMGLLRPR